MADYYYYCKLALDPAFLDAMRYGNLREKCKMILLQTMSDRNIVRSRIVTDKRNKPKRVRLVEAMAALTETTPRSIEKQLKQLNDSGFGKWDQEKNIFVVHRKYARKGNRKNPPEYDGVNPRNDDEQGLLAQLWLNFETRTIVRDMRKVNMTKAMMKKMESMETTLNEMCALMRMVIQKPDDNATREKIERVLEKQEKNHLRRVK